MSCTVAVERAGVEQRVHVYGELDVEHVDAFESAVASAEREEPDQLVIDLSLLSFMDSAALRVLLAAHHRAQTAPWDLTVVPGAAAVQRLFEITGADALFVTAT